MTEKFIVEATIPTVQYGNVRPVIELEGDDWETLRDQGLQRIKEVSDMVAGDGYAFEVRGLPVNTGRTVMQVEDSGREYFSDLLKRTTTVKERNGHIYLDGYMSGSKFPEQFYAPFDRERILNAIVDKFGVSANDVASMWKLNNEASTGYGTAIHAALENFDKNMELGDKIKSVKEFKKKEAQVGPNKALSKNPFLKAIVEWFQEIESDRADGVLTEQFIWDDAKKLSGSVDRIKIMNLANRTLRIQDYKTDGDIHDKKYQLKDSPFKEELGNELLDYHWLQLSFYAHIMQQAGWTVEGLDIFWLNPNKLVKGENPWEKFSREVIDITKGLK